MPKKSNLFDTKHCWLNGNEDSIGHDSAERSHSVLQNTKFYEAKVNFFKHKIHINYFLGRLRSQKKNLREFMVMLAHIKFKNPAKE